MPAKRPASVLAQSGRENRSVQDGLKYAFRSACVQACSKDSVPGFCGLCS